MKVIDQTRPFAQSFWGKKIKFVVIRNDDGKYDTLGMDMDGNINYVKRYWLEEKSEYNADHFLIRFFKKSDTYVNGLIFYKQTPDSIVQFWIRLNHNRWKLDADDSIAVKDTFKIVFKLDKSNQIISKQLEGDSKESFTYEDGRLIESKFREFRTVYFYNNQELRRIEKYTKNEITEIHYFNDKTGLPDSTVEKLNGYPDRKLQYKYIYY